MGSEAEVTRHLVGGLVDFADPQLDAPAVGLPQCMGEGHTELDVGTIFGDDDRPALVALVRADNLQLHARKASEWSAIPG